MISYEIIIECSLFGLIISLVGNFADDTQSVYPYYTVLVHVIAETAVFERLIADVNGRRLRSVHVYP